MKPFNSFTTGPLFQSLDEIITGAVAAAPGEIEAAGAIKPEGTEDTAPSDKKLETKVETKVGESEGEELDEYGLTKGQQIEAKQLLAALRDPAKAVTVIDFLAQQAGYKKGEIEELTPKEVKEAKKDLMEELKEALGPELSYIAEKMGPVLEKHLATKVEESQKDIRAKISENELTKFQSEAEAAQTELGTKYFKGAIPDAVATEMNGLIDEFPPSGKKSMKDYLEDILILAAGRKGVPLGTKAAADTTKIQKIERNRNDATQRLASEGRVVPKVGEVAINPKRQMSLEDSIADALEKVKAEL